jgi:putative acetyltransferase
MERSDSNKRYSAGLEVRHSEQADLTAIESLYPEAFPDEDLLPLARDLLSDSGIAVSLVGVMDSQIVSHVIFTRCSVRGSSSGVSLLAPLAVAPAWQQCGIGSRTVRAGLKQQMNDGVQLVCVLGDPAYYGRLGFTAETFVEPPYRLPAEWEGAWQSQYLDDDTVPIAGRLSVPSPWLPPELWAP